MNSAIGLSKELAAKCLRALADTVESQPDHVTFKVFSQDKLEEIRWNSFDPPSVRFLGRRILFEFGDFTNTDLVVREMSRE